MSQSVGEVLIESFPPPRIQIKGREIGQRWVGFFLVIFDLAVIWKERGGGSYQIWPAQCLVFTLLQLQLDTAPAGVDKVNNLQILWGETETLPLLSSLQAG